jgi:asparagine synthase (glutamine-hydrolysing)
MAHGLEVRVPLVDHVLLGRVAATQPALRRARSCIPKAALAQSPGRPLPQRISARPKTGFATPIADWLHTCGLPTPTEQRSEIPNNAHWSRRWAGRLAVVWPAH